MIGFILGATAGIACGFVAHRWFANIDAVAASKVNAAIDAAKGAANTAPAANT